MNSHARVTPILITIMLASAVAVAACADDVARSVERSATPRPDAATPTVTATAQVAPAPSTGIQALDEIVDAVIERDVDALMSRVAYESMACVRMGQLGSPVQCPEGVSEGTALDAFVFAHCDGGWLSPDRVRAAFERLHDDQLSLYAVLEVRSPEPGKTYLIVFEQGAPPSERGWWFGVRDGRIVWRGGPCVPLAQSDIFVNPIEVLVPPPDER